MTLLLQSPIRKSELIAVFFLRARMIQRALDLASAVATRLAAGGLVPQTFNVLHEHASGPPGSARRSFDLAQDGEPVEPSHDAVWRFRPSTGLGTLSKSKGHEQSWIMRARPS